MPAEITKKTDTHITFSFTVSPGELDHARQHAIDHYRDRVKASGFRPGKAPDQIVIREIGDNTIQSEVIDHAIQHAYGDALTEHKLKVIGSPKIDIKKWVPYTTLEVEAEVEIIPPVTLPDYKKIRQKMPETKVESEKVDQIISDLQRRMATRVPAVRASEMGDELKIDFDGQQNGQAVEGASGKGFTLQLGSKTFIPGFEEALVGVKAGDNKTFTVTFPDDYHEATLAGQPVEFTVKVHEVTELQLPEVTDKFAAQVGPFKTVAELKADAQDQLKSEAEREVMRQYENDLLDKLVSKTKVAHLPQKLVSQQLERLKTDMTQRLNSSGVSLEQYLELQKKSQADLEKELQPEAEKRVKLALMLSAVAEAEGTTVSVEEIDRELAALKAQYQDPQMQEQLSHDHVREDIYNHLMATKVITSLINYAQKTK